MALSPHPLLAGRQGCYGLCFDMEVNQTPTSDRFKIYYLNNQLCNDNLSAETEPGQRRAAVGERLPS
jgi:hypothetical protein